MANLESPITLACMSLNCGRKPEGTRTGKRITCKLRTERPQLVDSNPDPSYCDATLLTTAPLCCVDKNLLPNKNSNQDLSFHSRLSSAAISALRFSHLTLHKPPFFFFFSCPCASLLHFLSFTGRFQLNLAWICLNFSKVLKSHQSCEAWVKWDCHFKKSWDHIIMLWYSIGKFSWHSHAQRYT